MRANMRSNTDSLEFQPDFAPASHVDIQNMSQIRDNRQPPSVFASDILTRARVAAHANYVSRVPRNSEKMDLISIMNSFALVDPSKDSRQVETVYAVTGQEQPDHERLAHVDAGEEKLSVLLAERYASKKVSAHAKHSQGWPSVASAPCPKKRIRGIKTEPCADELSGLDLQLYQASQSQCSSESTTQSAEVELKYTQSLCEEIKPYKIHVDLNSQALTWTPHYHMHSSPPVYEPLRAPSEAMRQLVRDRLFLLDDYCFDVKRGSANSNAFNVTSKDRLIRQATEKIDISIVAGLQDQMSPAQLESIKVCAQHDSCMDSSSLSHVSLNNVLKPNSFNRHNPWNLPWRGILKPLSTQH